MTVLDPNLAEGVDHALLAPRLDLPVGTPQGLPLYIDSSILTTYRSCKKKMEWSYIRNLSPLGESIHLLAGGAVAAAMEAIRNYQFLPQHRSAPLHVDELLAVGAGPFLRAWKGYEPSEEETKNQHNVFHALEAYLQEYPPFYDPVQPIFRADDTPSTEYTFAIPLPVKHPSGEPFIFVGRFDLLGEYSGLKVVLDEKTTSALGPSWLSQWDLRGQFLGYMWACRQLGHRVDHVIVRGIAIQKTQHQIVSVPVAYPDHLIELWFDELVRSLHDLVAYYSLGHWSYNFGDACSSYGGCGFRDLCKAKEPSSWFNNFQTRTWTPISQDNAA